MDAVRFERLARGGRRALRNGDSDTAARLLREALELWRGEALADISGAPFAAPAIVALNELRLAALEDRIAAGLQTSADDAHVVAELEELTAAHPLRERLRFLLVKALHGDGQAGRGAAGV